MDRSAPASCAIQAAGYPICTRRCWKCCRTEVGQTPPGLRQTRASAPPPARASHRMTRHLGDQAFRRVLLLCLLVYLFSAKGNVEVEDTRYSIETAQAIVTRGQLDIPYSESYTLRAPDGKSYSKYGIGLALYYVPWVAASGVLSRLVHLPWPELTSFLISFANIPFAILTIILFARLLRLFGLTGSYVWLLALGLGLGTPTWHYAVSDFSEAM